MKVAEVVEMPTQLQKELMRLDELVFSAVDEILKHVFKEEGTKTIYTFVENKCHVNMHGIVERPEDFSGSLRELLGSAAPVIENMIVRNLCSKAGLEFEEREGFGFADYVKELRERSS